MPTLLLVDYENVPKVVGYDNAHNFHHRHYFGAVEDIEFVTFENVEERFQADWLALRSKK